jgi:hypothetical protein
MTFQEIKTILEMAKIRLKGPFILLNQTQIQKYNNLRAHASVQKRRKESKKV